MRLLVPFLLVLSTGAAAQDPERVIDAARQGGVTVVCRHAITDHSHREVEPVDYDDPDTQRRLSPEGERQSRDMGRAIVGRGIVVGEVVASPMQRARRTAELMFGRASIDSTWHTNGSEYGGAALEARRRALATVPGRGTRFIVSHIGTMQSVLTVTRDIDEGDCIVVRPRGSDFEVVGVVPWRAWSQGVRR